MLRGEEGEWVEDTVILQDMVNKFCKDLFLDNDGPAEWFQSRVTFPSIPLDCYGKLAGDISNDEVKSAMFGMGAWKAPGPDGFPADFYQHAWSELGPAVCKFVRDVWDNPELIASVNFTDICLIPKVPRPEFVSQFRPISLCNSIYKVVSKVIVNRLKEIIPTVISPNQAGFVPGRSIHEHIVVAQEMVHSMRRLTGRKGAFAIKVDLPKAYDKLKWSFVSNILREVGLPLCMVKVIEQCMSSVQTNVLWNGVRTSFFSPQRGIRQGDPVSPYLFVLCIAKLSHFISQAVEEGGWKALRAGRRGPLVSHLMFVDDLVLFGEAFERQMDCVLSILYKLCAISGQQVSAEKTSILFSNNVRASLRCQLVEMSGFRETNSLGKYLGVPIIGRGPRRSDF